MTFRTIEVKLQADISSYTAKLGAAASATKAFGQEVGQLAASKNEAVQAAGKLGVVVGGTIVAGFALAVGAAAKFETGMRNANSIMKQSESELRATSAAVLDLSREVPQAATTLAAGLYDIASSGFQGAEGLVVLEASAVAATAGMTDTATSAKAITAVLNAYGREARDATDISDVLFQTVNLGVLTFEELAQNVGDWVGTAAALGVDVDDASAALATMTLAGINAAEASTALNRVMQSFIKPSAEMTTAIEELGYESGVAMVEALGLKGAVEAIDEATGGSVEQTANLYREVRAIKGVLALTAADGKNYADVFDQITDEIERAGAAQEAYEEQSKAFSVQLDLAKSSLSAVAIEIGTNFLPILTGTVQMVGSVADAFAALPGPVKGTLTVLTGIAGVVGLLGGAAILAAPRIAKFNEALLDMATRPGGSATATRVIEGLSGAIGSLGRALPVVGTALVAGAAVMTAHGRATAEAQDAVDDYTTALEEQGTALGALTRLTTQQRLAEGFLGGDLQDAAANLDVLAEALERQPYLMQEFADQARTGKRDVEGMAAALEGAGLAGTAFGDEILRIFDTGELGPRSANELLQRLDLLAGAYVNASAATSDNADRTKEEAAAAFEAASREAEKLGINLNEASELSSLTADEMGDLQRKIDPVIFSMVELGSVTVEEAEAMQNAMESYVDSVEQSFGRLTSPLAIHGRVLESQEEAARAAAEHLAKVQNDDIGKRGDAIREAAERNAQAVLDEAEAFIEITGASGNAARDIRRDAQDRSKAIRDAADDEVEALDGTKRTWEDYAEQAKVSQEQYIAGLQLTAYAAATFMGDIKRAIEAGYDPQFIAELLAAGPETAAPILETILSDHSGTMVGLVNDSVAALRELNTQAGEMARLTHLAVTSSTDQMNQDLSAAMAIAQANMAEGGRLSAEALAGQLGLGVAEVARIAAEYGITLVESINPVLRGLGVPEITANQLAAQEGGTRTSGLQLASGGEVPGAGDGDTVPAMLTPGEFVVRKAAVRAIGVDQLERINRVGFAAGGLVPAPPDVSRFGTIVGYAGGAAMEHAYLAVRGFAAGGLVDRVGPTTLTGAAAGRIDYDRLARILGERQLILQVPESVAANMNERDLARELRSAEYLADGP